MARAILRLCRRLILVALILLCLVPAASGAVATPRPARSAPSAAPASISVNPTTVVAGGQVTITGTGFANGETINLSLQALNSPTTQSLGSAHADNAGNFTLNNVTIPLNTPAGSYLIVAVGTTSGSSATAALAVTSPPSSATISVTPTSVPASGQVTVTGTGFATNETIQLFLSSATLGSSQLMSTQADGSGKFNSTIPIPASVAPGSYLLVAIGLSSLRQASTPLQVTTAQSSATVTITPTTVVAGGQFTITGTGFFAGETINVTLQTPGSPGSQPLGSTHADSAGNFALSTVTIPISTPAGHYLVVATGQTTGRTASAALTVAAPPATLTVNPTTFTPNSTIAVTGTGFVANETVFFILTNGPTAISIGQVQADASGNFAATSVKVPFGVPAGPAQLIATGRSSNRQATVNVTVTATSPTLSVTPSTADTGTGVTVTGANFQPGETVTLSLATIASTTTLGTATVGSDGTFSTSVTIPRNAAQGVAALVATGGTSHLSATAAITIRAVSVTLALSSSTVTAGHTLSVSGSGFIPGETVSISIKPTNSTTPPTPLAVTVANTTGSFTISSLTIPASLNGGYTVTASGQTSGRTASATLTVMGAPPSTPVLTIIGIPGPPFRVSPGGLVQVAGSSFAANAGVSLILTGSNLTVTLGAARANASGAFGPTGVTIPATVPAGTYTLHAVVNGSSVASVAVDVVTLSPSLLIDRSSLVPGELVTVTGSGFAPGEQVVLALNGAALATSPSTIVAGPNGGFRATFTVPASINNGPNSLTATGVTSRAGHTLIVVGRLPQATARYYFPNGDTSAGARTIISLLNPTNGADSVTLTFLYQTEPERSTTVSVPAHAHLRVDLGLVAGAGRHIATIVVATRAIAASSTVYYPNADSASSLGAGAPGTLWYLAEGYTGGSFTESLAIMNPNTSFANVDVRFLPFNGRPPVEERFSVRPRSLITVNAAQYMPRQSFSIVATADRGVVVERTMHFGLNHRGAHAKIAVARASTVWQFAQGQSAPDRQTFLTILNPNQASPATVTATFYDNTGRPVGNSTIVVNPLRRGNIKLNDVLPNARVGIVATSSVPVVVERPFYLGPANLDLARAGSDVFGGNGGSSSSLFPGGDVTGGNLVQFLVFNPSLRVNTITITFYTSTGSTIVRNLALAPNSSGALNANTVPGLTTGTFGARVQSTNGQPFVAEERIQNSSLGQLSGNQGLAE